MSDSETATTTGAPDDVAIVGMACVVPGAANLQSYWENILAKVDAVGEPPPDWGAERCFDPDSAASDRVYCVRGGYLGALAAFDPIAYGIMPSSVDGGEPDHFLALRAAHEALDDAGYLSRGLPRERVEVIIGRGSYVNRGNTTAIQHGIIVDQFLRVLKDLHPEHGDEDLARIRLALKASLPPFHAETAAALVPNVISGRIANRLDFMGSNFIVDAACASSLVAVDLGMRDLLSGRCDVAVVGGVHASTPPVILMIFCQLKAIARSGMIRPFDRRADGTLLGEGVGMVVLKRRRDAERDGDRIYALLKGVGIASDGRGLGLLAPRLEGEELALRRAYAAAAVDPATVGLIEAHGTATVVGDATEVEALRRVFARDHRIHPRAALGSVKSMISHLMPAAGIASIIKVALALHHRVLPPTINCEQPSPGLQLEDGPLYLNTDTRPWVHGAVDHPRRAGVNAFGFGGINAHAVLEEYPGNEDHSLAQCWESEVVVVTAPDQTSLSMRVFAIAGRLAARSEVTLAAVAATLNTADHGPSRLAVVATSIDDLAAKLERAGQRLQDPNCAVIRDVAGIYYAAKPLALEGRLAFVFPGEGSQYPNMLADLAIHFPVVRRFFDLMDRAFTGHPRGYLPSEVIFPVSGNPAGGERIWRMDAGAEAVFAANQALAALLSSLGICPDALLGHSTGEHSALLAAAAVQVRDDDALISYVREVNSVYAHHEARGEIPDAVLVAVGGAEPGFLNELVARAAGALFIAMDNCPHQVVLSGTVAAIDAAILELETKRAICQRLPFGRPYHTPWFEFFCAPLREFFATVRVETPRVALYSCVTAAPFPDDPNSVRDLASQQWARPVRFRETVQAMYRDGVRMFVEVGPRGHLTGFINDTLRGKRFLAVASNVQAQSGIRQLHHLLAQLFAQGVAVHFEALYSRRGVQRIDLEADPPPAPRQRMRIRTGLQPLQLPEGFSLRTAGDDSGPAVGSSAVGAQRANAAVCSPAGTSAAIAQTVGHHLETMQQFLAVQNQVMGAYFQRRDGAWRAGAGSHEMLGSAESTKTGAAGAALAAAPGLASWPLIGDVTEFSPGQRVVTRRRLSCDQDLFLLDHTLGRDVSSDDPSLLALPVVPLTFTMEMLGEVAALLQPGRVLIGMREVRAYRWITIEQPVTLEVTALVRTEDGEVEARVREFLTAEGTSPTLAEAILVFADCYPAAGSSAGWQIHDEAPSRWVSANLYRHGMFHGPRFRGVRSIDRTGADGTTASLEILPRDALLAGQPSPDFVTDPVLLDAAGQVVAFWVLERFQSGLDIFPYRLERLDLFFPPLAVSTRPTCRVRTEMPGETRLSSDIEILDDRGAVWCRFTGWEDRRFELPRALIELRGAPRESFLARSWPEALGRCDGAGNAVCTLIEGYPETLLEAHSGVWAKMLAHLVLGRRERELWARLGTASAKRRREWLLGRCAAKDAVRRLLIEHGGPRLCSADVEILPDADGRPEVHGALKAATGFAPVVSIAHSGGWVTALAARSSEWLSGIDIETNQALANGLETHTFRAEELALLGALAPDAFNEWVLRLWCAREAACKAVGRWGEDGLHSFRVTALDLTSGTVSLEPGVGARRALPFLERVSVNASTARIDELLVSTVLLRLDSEL